MLKAYFDDSGKNEQSVGGCVADLDSWASFEPAWRAVLDQFHIEWYHAVDFEGYGPARKEHQKSNFPPMEDAERAEFRHALVGVLQDHVGVSVSHAVSVSAGRWGGYVCAIVPPDSVAMLEHLDEADRVTNRLGKPQPRSRNERLTEDIVAHSNDPYGHCLQQAFGMAAAQFAMPLDESVRVFVADQPKKRGLIDLAYKIVRSSPKFGHRFIGIDNGNHMNPRDIVPLQAADFAAYYLTKAKRNPLDPVAMEMSALLQPQYVEYSDGLYLTRGYLWGNR